MIQLHRTFFSTTTSSSVPSSHSLSLRHFMLQFRALQTIPLGALVPDAAAVTGTTATVKCGTRLWFPRRVTAKSHATFSAFRFPNNTTPVGGGGVFSRGFATRAVENGKEKKRAKAKASVVRGNEEKDEGVVNDTAAGEINIVAASEGGLGKEQKKKKKKKGSSGTVASGEEDEKNVKKKTAKKNKTTMTTSRSKKVSASTQEDGAAEVSTKASKGKKKVFEVGN